jgi:hypothetical protein
MSGQARPPARDYESTVMRIAGNLLSGRSVPMSDLDRRDVAADAVALARAIVAETNRSSVKGQCRALPGVLYRGPHGDIYIGLADGSVAWKASTAIPFDPAAFMKVEE